MYLILSTGTTENLKNLNPLDDDEEEDDDDENKDMDVCMVSIGRYIIHRTRHTILIAT